MRLFTLQESRVWMAERRPTDIADDDCLFPMLNSRMGDALSDVESSKGVSAVIFIAVDPTKPL